MLAGCLPPDEVVGGEPVRDLAIYRIERGDCLSVIADQLGYRGGWRAGSDPALIISSPVFLLT